MNGSREHRLPSGSPSAPEPWRWHLAPLRDVFSHSAALCRMHTGCVGQGEAISQSPTQNPCLEGAVFVSHTAFRTQCPAWIPLHSWCGPGESRHSLSLWLLVCIKSLLWLKDRRGEMIVNGLGQEAPHIDPRQVQEPRKPLGLEGVAARVQGQL